MPAELDSNPAMRKRRKVLIILGLMALAAVCFIMLSPRDEPKYQGRYLSEWMEALTQDSPGGMAFEAERAVEAIGTNGLPWYLEWMRHQPPQWRSTVADRLPQRIQASRAVFAWRLDTAGQQRARGSIDAFRILGTNAVSAIPELKAMLSDHANRQGADGAITALARIGEPAIPVLEGAFVDPQQVNRWYILWGFSELVRKGHTNRCLPKLVDGLTHTDVSVRLAATNFVQQLAPELLTNAPAQP